ncbi:MAG: 4-hydroxythreonine-4-phosphate dehydrogenase PdxA [Halobacteriovoraceae bacterium]|nr:4-hydroxythreonine-4-phosphate dehydrogenase PdxA [Halobacteriovoraceae bacterium]
MIFITQGHEKSISLEIFIKSLFHFSRSECERFHLIADKKVLQEQLKLLKIQSSIEDKYFKIGHKKILASFIDEKSPIPQTSQCLQKALELITSKDVLVTLPSSKDQFLLDKKILKGHTEYFREYFQSENLSMVFYKKELKILLITDHIPLLDVTPQVKEQSIIKKTELALKFFKNIKFVHLSGINPHAGENGLLGTGEEKIREAIKSLSKSHPTVLFKGPEAGDTLIKSTHDNRFYIYMHHDQGLGVFKSLSGYDGLHLTLGLPFIRLSPDHGTAFDLYGRNKANYSGALSCLQEAIKFHERNNHQ